MNKKNRWGLRSFVYFILLVVLAGIISCNVEPRGGDTTADVVVQTNYTYITNITQTTNFETNLIVLTNLSFLTNTFFDTNILTNLVWSTNTLVLTNISYLTNFLTNTVNLTNVTETTNTSWLTNIDWQTNIVTQTNNINLTNVTQLTNLTELTNILFTTNIIEVTNDTWLTNIEYSTNVTELTNINWQTNVVQQTNYTSLTNFFNVTNFTELTNTLVLTNFLTNQEYLTNQIELTNLTWLTNWAMLTNFITNIYDVTNITVQTNIVTITNWYTMTNQEPVDFSDPSEITLVGAVVTNGRTTNALYFDGSSYAVISNSEAVNFSGDLFTLSVWVKWETDPFDWGKNQGQNFANVVSKNGDSQWQLAHGNWNRKFEFNITTTSGTFTVASSTQPAQGVWYHVAAVYDGVNLTLYVDGVEEDQTAATGFIVASDTDVNIGRRSEFEDRYFFGVVDRLGIYSEAWSSDAVLMEYSSY